MRKERMKKLLFALKISEKIGINAGIWETLLVLDEYPFDTRVIQVLQNMLMTALKKESRVKLDQRILCDPRVVSLLKTCSVGDS